MYNEKPRKESIWYGIFPKNFYIKLFEKFKRIMISIINLKWYPYHYYFWNVVFFPQKKSPPWLKMYVFYMSTEVIFLGRHISNKNNNQAPEVHEIIFLFKIYMIFVIIQINTIRIIIKYLKCLTFDILFMVQLCIMFSKTLSSCKCFNKNNNRSIRHFYFSHEHQS